MGSLSIFIKKSTIPFFVFVTGACVLIIEVLAVRILSPYFGNTIFSLSSVISVVLGALCAGYFVGGRVADKYPKEELFYGIIGLSGFCIIFLHLLGIIFLSAFGYNLSIVQGPIIASVLLFFLQNFLLGMLSPFAVKLQAMRLDPYSKGGIGSISGEIFFWSTLGSIVGSLSAGFFLIPHFGIDTIILSVGCLLIILGFCAFLKITHWIKGIKFFLIIVLIIFFLLFVHYFASSINSFYAKSVVYSRDLVYQKVTIYDDQYQGRPARFLVQDKNPSAAEFIDSPDLAYEYTKYYALYNIFNPNITQALVIGGGAYSVPKALLSDAPKLHIDVAEIEPSLFALSKQYFSVPDDLRLQNFAQDGRRLLASSHKKYDLIFSDAYASLYSTPSHLTTQEFFSIAKNKLNNKGIFMANVIGSLSPSKESLLLSEIKTFKSVFPNSYFFAVTSLEYKGLQNIIFIGYNSNSNIDVNSQAIKHNKNPIISHLSEKEINLDAFNFSLYPILTDNFSPVEYLTAKELEASHY